MKATIAKSSTGLLALASGFGISIADVNAILQTISLLIGIAIGCVSFISLVVKRKNKNQPKE